MVKSYSVEDSVFHIPLWSGFLSPVAIATAEIGLASAKKNLQHLPLCDPSSLDLDQQHLALMP